MAYDLVTPRGYNMYDCASLMQKAIRRGEIENAGIAAYELAHSFHKMAWNRLLCVSAEDCFGVITKEIVKLYLKDAEENRGKKGYYKNLSYISDAVNVLCKCLKSRDADYYACNLIYSDFCSNRELDKSVKAEDCSSISMENFKIENIDTPFNVKKDNVEFSLFDKREDSPTVILSKNLQRAIISCDIESQAFPCRTLVNVDNNLLWKTLLYLSDSKLNGMFNSEIVALKIAEDIFGKNKDVDPIFSSKACCLLGYAFSKKIEGFVGLDEIQMNSCSDIDKSSFVDIKNCSFTEGDFPKYTFDVHTLKGKKMGKTDWDMIIDEEKALHPLKKAFFDGGSWAWRYDYKKRNGKVGEKEYAINLEYRKTHNANPVDNLISK